MGIQVCCHLNQSFSSIFSVKLTASYVYLFCEKVNCISPTVTLRIGWTNSTQCAFSSCWLSVLLPARDWEATSTQIPCSYPTMFMWHQNNQKGGEKLVKISCHPDACWLETYSIPQLSPHHCCTFSAPLGVLHIIRYDRGSFPNGSEDFKMQRCRISVQCNYGEQGWRWISCELKSEPYSGSAKVRTNFTEHIFSFQSRTKAKQAP